MKKIDQIKKDRKEAKKFVESLRPEDKKYWVINEEYKGTKPEFKIVYSPFYKKLITKILVKYWPVKFNKFDL